MIRLLPVVALMFVAMIATPLDAQIFRRFGRQPASPRPSSNQSAQNGRQGQPTNAPTPATANRISPTQSSAPKPAATLSGPQPQTQRYGVYYNPRTNRTTYRPIQSALNSNSGSRRFPILRRMGDRARQVQRTIQLPVEQFTLNAPNRTTQPIAEPSQPPASRVVATPTPTPTPTPGSSESNALANSTAIRPATQIDMAKSNSPTSVPAEATKQTFSILESDKK